LSEHEVHLPSVIGRGYKDFWNFKGRYLVCKGSRGSKKSTTAALKIIYEMMRIPDTHALVIRKFASLHGSSTFAQLRWAINRLHVDHLWKVRHNPATLTYMPTGQTIQFRGMDDPLAITSITVPKGAITFVWIEEAYQIQKEDDFNKLDLSIRGIAPEGAYKQFILTFNPWNASHWIKSRFFDVQSPNVLAMTTNYLCNEWLSDDDIAIFEDMKVRFPRRYQVEGLGEWGHSEGVIYQNWRVEDFDWQDIYLQKVNGVRRFVPRFGMDFGFSTDPTTFSALLVSERMRKIYIFDEMYEYHMTNQQIADRITEHGYHKVKIIADSAEPRTINELYRLGLTHIHGAKKGPDSVRFGIQKLQDFEMVVHPSCKNHEMELSNYAWALDKAGNPTQRPASDGFDHLMDAMRYAVEDIGASRFSF
jgi:phage terminase large subunit